MTERAEITSLGFSVADAERPQVILVGRRLVLSFVDMAERPVTVVFADTIAARWQEAEYLIDAGDRDDVTVVVHGSEWLVEHERQNLTWRDGRHRHLKLNFNAAGILEILCTTVEVQEAEA